MRLWIISLSFNILRCFKIFLVSKIWIEINFAHVIKPHSYETLYIIKGEMVFVGPRPALYNQDDLMALRVGAGVDQLKPGLTGWAQINGRDEISIEEKVAYEKEYLQRKSLGFDLIIVVRTFTSVLSSKGVAH